MSSLFKATFDQPEKRLRLVSKFCEHDFEKINRLCELHTRYREKVAKIDQEIEEEKAGMAEEDVEIDEEIATEFYLKRLEEGLLTLQLVDLVLVFLAVDFSVPDVRTLI